MKILTEKYPKGSLKGQHTPGRYIDGILYDNLSIMAKKIVDDMTFLGICYSSTLEVGTGKSVFCTQVGEAWTHLMKEIHGIDIPFDMKNVVFRPKDLIARAFQVPKYSFILCDEWDDAHYWSELGMTLRKFFRKCRQLNLFIMIIIPNYFQLPITYALNRSFFAIDVRFEGELERGYFYFYNFQKKQDLYIKGKKFYNYRAVQESFFGRFTDGYGVNEAEYRKAKLEDMQQYDKEDKDTALELQTNILKKLKEIFPNEPISTWEKVFNKEESTLYRWLRADGVLSGTGGK